MLVSVCLPTYNGSRYIEQAIDSVLAQSHTDIELLISDDRSEDGTFDIVQRKARDNNKIICWQNEKRSGLFGNYNTCLRRTRGEAIKPFAQDDLLKPDAIERMARALTDNKGVNLVCADRDGGSDRYRAHAADALEETIDAGRSSGKQVILQCLRTFRNLIGEPVSVMFRTGKVTLLFDEQYASLGDLDLWLRLLECGDLYHLKEPLVTFRQHDESQTATLLKNMDWVLDFYRLSKQYARYLSEIGTTRDEYCMRFAELSGGLIDELVSQGRLEISAMDGYREVAYFSMRRCAQLAFKSREYDSMLNSTSWRITKPLRSLMRRLSDSR